MANETSMPRGLRIRSGGQSGADRAALDAAIITGHIYEGWCPKGGWAEDFPDPLGLLKNYPGLRETPSASPGERTAWNVRDSAATMILVPGPGYVSPGTDFTIACARRYARPCHVIHYLGDSAPARIRAVLTGLGEDQSINIAGPREHPGADERCLALLSGALGAPRGGAQL
jgi:hypothetical protein